VSRDLVLAALVFCVGGWLLQLGGAVPLPARPGPASGGSRERRLWRRLWSPVLPALAAVAALLGWAAQEPSVTDELLSPLALACAAPLLLVLGRAVWRALQALRRSGQGAPAVTVGLLRPRVTLHSSLHRVLDEAGLGAARAHEDAHRRHRDPLRIWGAQIVTDLQWPWPAARARFDEWLAALEIARDEEARRQGVRGEDLAAAIIAAARVARAGTSGAAAGLTHAAWNFVVRIERLLEPLPAGECGPGPWLQVLVLALACAGVGAGLSWGDTLVRALPFVRS
jgi:hypothetical protein